MKNKSVFLVNTALLVVGFLTAISSVQLEVSSGRDYSGISFDRWVWLHMVICLICMIGVGYHLYLHWAGVSKWLSGIATLKSKQTKWLVWLSVITFLSGILSGVSFLIVAEHNGIGKVHGKFGLVVIVLTILHIVKRFSWYRDRHKDTSFYPIIDLEKCVRCGKCVKVCPAQIIAKQDKRIIIQNPEFCRQCYKCVDNCPKQSIKRTQSSK